MSTTDSLSNPTGTVTVSSPPQRTWSDWFSGHVETAKKAVGVSPATDSGAAANALGTPAGDTMLGGGYRKRRNVTRNRKVVGRKKTRGRR
jgi:hypothetical protein